MTISCVAGNRRTRNPKEPTVLRQDDARSRPLYAPLSAAPLSRFSRSRISLPVLKNGTLF
jgi:hypothetical protein